MDSACLGGVLEASERRYLQSWLDSSLLHSDDHIAGQARLGLQSSGAQWVLAAALEAAKGGAVASLPDALPVTLLWPGHLPPALPARPGPAGSQSQGLLCPANDHAASSPGHHPSSGKAAANYRACWPRQQLGQESQPLAHHILWP